VFTSKPRISSLSSILERTFTSARWRQLADTLRLAVRRSSLSRIYGRSAAALVQEHFAGMDPHAIVTSSRTFPEYMRVDLNRTLERLLPRGEIRCVGVHERYGHQTLEYATLLQPDGQVSLAPLRFDDVHIGEAIPARCLVTALWLIPATETRAAHVVLLSPAKRYGQLGGWHLEIAVPAGAAGEAVVTGIFDALEAALTRSASYRGKVLSLEREQQMMGMGASVLVHRLAPVAREDVILPAATLHLLERNVFQFAARREALRAMGLPVKKGLLFYGPPGTGKTHTIRYLAGALPGHTTLLVTAEQVANIADYMTLARLLSPAIVVIEDADLIARQREHLGAPFEEALLNRLLNEMDGLRDNAEILFVLTTNRPEALEMALTARPGRIDQAIEFPLPDADGRRKLARLYGKAAPVAEATLDYIAERTARVSPAFIKELMRRSAQLALDHGPQTEVTLADVDAALDELLFSGGRLNAALLGALGARPDGEGAHSS
jgi:energy-coupling factor transporter ATP-binding protein EcfA2